MRRVRELDGLRAIAVIAVLWLHAATLCPALRFGPIMRWGSTAVDLFFVISGFLITGIILNSGGSPGFLTTFYVRRSLRIWPIYYLCLLGIAAVNPILPRPFAVDGLGYYLTYLQGVPSYWAGRTPEFCKAFAHTWSLAVEEQFYLIWPGLVLWLGSRRLARACGTMIAIAIAARASGVLDSQLLLTRCDGLAMGAGLALVLSETERVTRHIARYYTAFAAMIAVGCLVVIAADLAGLSQAFNPLRPDAILVRIGKSLTLFACNVAFAGMIGLCACGSGHRRLRFLRVQWVCGLGTISYGLYLYHNLLLAFAHQRLGRPDLSPAAAVAALVGTLVLAILSWRFVEKPILNLKDRFAYDRPRGERGRGALQVSRG
ncbi:MAG: putative acyltransferase [Planctomycetota bacterium]|nr:putative acyltransferase [Planctomycetota bacterium]